MDLKPLENQLYFISNVVHQLGVTAKLAEAESSLYKARSSDDYAYWKTQTEYLQKEIQGYQRKTRLERVRGWDVSNQATILQGYIRGMPEELRRKYELDGAVKKLIEDGNRLSDLEGRERYLASRDLQKLYYQLHSDFGNLEGRIRRAETILAGHTIVREEEVLPGSAQVIGPLAIIILSLLGLWSIFFQQKSITAAVVAPASVMPLVVGLLSILVIAVIVMPHRK